MAIMWNAIAQGKKKQKKKKKAKQKTAMSITGITLLDLYDFVNIFP